MKGSPIFLMRLCYGARHIEVQVGSPQKKHRAAGAPPTNNNAPPARDRAQRPNPALQPRAPTPRPNPAPQPRAPTPRPRRDAWPRVAARGCAWPRAKLARLGRTPVHRVGLTRGGRRLSQVMADKHKNVAILSGRDCSMQRRFQKIVEEGPPTTVSPATMREMELAAARLALMVDYTHAGTVEYLFIEKTQEFFFLELNPRLQVEHPVTEGITGQNIPALQLMVAMGIDMTKIDGTLEAPITPVSPFIIDVNKCAAQQGRAGGEAGGGERN